MPKDLNHFAKFNLPIKFNIDLDDLENKYLDFQLKFHPDKLIADPDSEDKIKNSIAINEAYQILQNPIKRAEYILKLNGIAIDSETKNSNQNSGKDLKLIRPDQQLLEKILLLQEQIENIKNQSQILTLKTELESTIKTILEKISNLLESQEFSSAASYLIEAKYLEKSRLILKSKKP
jgi:molecular chaperone HscB